MVTTARYRQVGVITLEQQRLLRNRPYMSRHKYKIFYLFNYMITTFSLLQTTVKHCRKKSSNKIHTSKELPSKKRARRIALIDFIMCQSWEHVDTRFNTFGTNGQSKHYRKKLLKRGHLTHGWIYRTISSRNVLVSTTSRES